MVVWVAVIVTQNGSERAAKRGSAADGAADDGISGDIRQQPTCTEAWFGPASTVKAEATEERSCVFAKRSAVSWRVNEGCDASKMRSGVQGPEIATPYRVLSDARGRRRARLGV